MEFGFSESQIGIYLAGLEYGPALMSDLAKAASMPRTSLLYQIDELVRRQFFRVRIKGKRQYYIAADSKKLLMLIEERARIIRSISPTLERIQASRRKQD